MVVLIIVSLVSSLVKEVVAIIAEWVAKGIDQKFSGVIFRSSTNVEDLAGFNGAVPLSSLHPSIQSSLHLPSLLFPSLAHSLTHCFPFPHHLFLWLIGALRFDSCLQERLDFFRKDRRRLTVNSSLSTSPLPYMLTIQMNQ